MIRTFRQHRIRAVESLDGLWDFTTDDSGPQPRRKPRRFDRKILVPSVWQRLPGLEAYRGQAWLRTQVTARPDRTIRLVFGGVSHTGTIFVNGKQVGTHYDAFTPFDVIAKPSTSDVELLVHVDNTFGDHSALHKPNDYYTYGGITRPVELQHVPEVFIERVAATPKRAGRRWALEVSIELRNLGQGTVKRGVEMAIAGDEYELGLVTVAAGETRIVTTVLDNLDVEAWQPGQPRLYELAVTLFDGDTPVDDQIERVGFRTFEVRGHSLLLNGRPIRLRGYNRHEDHSQFGCAIPLEAMTHDLALIQDLGCNFVRTSHYPNDQRFLDLCDELGICVWEESHARQIDMNHPRFAQQIDASTEEMLRWHHNHPSIVMWGILNECDSHAPEQKHHYARLLKMIRRTDPSRPRTFASHRSMNDRCFGLADIVAINVYRGWYGADVGTIRPWIENFIRWLDSPRSRGGAGKPLIISEFGAGAIPGYRAPHRSHWTEEYQCDVLDAELKVYLHHPRISGTAIWQFCDVRITPEDGWWNRRPRTMNNKGTVDQHRQPKLVYEIVKRRHSALVRGDGR
jgi:beta-glucuronidase